MKVYHGSLYQVHKPHVKTARPSTDFGKCFYTTTNYEQAKRWAIKKQKTAKEEAKAALMEVYNSWLSRKIEDFNSSLYQENPGYLYESYSKGEVL